MARPYINEKQMPKLFWFCAIKYIPCIQNIFPIKYNNTCTTLVAGIAVGWSDTANVLLVYKQITKEIYTTSICKIDERNTTRNYFNLFYDEEIYSDLYSIYLRKILSEYFPIGISVSIPFNTGPCEGCVWTVPSTDSNPTSLHSYPLYTIQLINHNITTAPATAMLMNLCSA